MNLCLGCMEEMSEGLAVCPRCGYNQATPPKEIYHLPPGTILHNKYIMGKVLGYGGFGVTYIGYDYNLGRKVAIKEFLPGDFSTRMPGQTSVTVYDGEATSQFEAGLGRFVEEAQRLAKLNYVSGVVDIYDTFIENNTGYIVMQFLDGDTVRDIIDKYGVMPYESVDNAIMNAFNIHTDMCTQSIDYFSEQSGCDEAENVIDKPIKKGIVRLPTWLKVVVSSVLVFVLVFIILVSTGIFDIIDGDWDDDMTPRRVPHVFGMRLSDAEKVLNDRGFAMIIYDCSNDEVIDKDTIKTQTPMSGKLATECKLKDGKGRFVVCVTVSGGHAPVVVPHVVDMALDVAKAQLEELGFVVEVEEEYNNDVEKGIVMLQDISNIEYAYGSTIHLTVSKGEMKVDKSKQHRLPNLVGMNYEDALKKLTSIGMYVKREERHDTAPDGEVVEQSIPEGTDLTEGETITLTVSSNVIVIPDVTYKQEDVARGLIESAGATVTVKYKKSSTVKSGNVISQSVVGKSTYGTKVKLVVSSGFESTKTKEKCPDCGSTSHTQHPTCPVCGSKAHTLHPACAYCGSTSHYSMQHPRCTYCGSTQHTTDGHQKCTYCGSTAHTFHPVEKCAVCGTTAHTTAGHPKCPTCGSTAHTFHPVEKCAVCGTTAHTTAGHPKCPTCGSTAHTVHPVEKCAVCGTTAHTTAGHP